MEVTATGAPISVPVGDGVLGRMFNVLGDAIDEKGPVSTGETWSIHRQPPTFENQRPVVDIFETGIKVIDLLAPRGCRSRKAADEESPGFTGQDAG